MLLTAAVNVQGEKDTHTHKKKQPTRAYISANEVAEIKSRLECSGLVKNNWRATAYS